MKKVTPEVERRRSLLHRYGREASRLSDHSEVALANLRGAKLRRVDALMRNVVESSFDGIMTLRADGRIATANPAAQKIFALSQEALAGGSILDLLPDLAPQTPKAAGSETLDLDEGPIETEGHRADGTSVPLEVAVSRTFADGEQLFVVILRDITERRRQQEQLIHQALHDALTGLPNRVLLGDRLEHALDFARHSREPMGLLLLDLDRFKEVNDTLGHHVGDRVLSEAAERLTGAIRASDTVARLGGDEFAVLLPAVSDLACSRMVAERIITALSVPFEVVEGLALDIGVSIGIALFPDHAEEAGKLLQCADVAMYAAKNDHLAVSLYDQGKDTHSVRHLTLTGELKRAIEQDELDFFYQPQIDIAKGAVISVEALARWDHPIHGAIPPDEFIPQAERTGLIEPLTRWAFGTALKKLVSWRKDSVPLSIAVNLSARNLHEKELPVILQQLCNDYAVASENLVLELTENALMADPDGALVVMHELADLGFRLSVDDFGTGYSSLAYLRHLPVSELKIDQSFVKGMLDSEEDLVIVRSTIDLAHNLGLMVVAEGVETPAHCEKLRELGCDIGQGYHIGRPMDEATLAKWFAKARWSIAAGHAAA